MALYPCGSYTPCTSQRRSRPHRMFMNFLTPRLPDCFFLPFFFLFIMGIYASLQLSPLPPLGPTHWMSPVDTWLWGTMSMPSWGGSGLGGGKTVMGICSFTPTYFQMPVYALGTMLLLYIHYRCWMSLCFMLSDVFISALLVLVQLRSIIHALYPP